MRSSITCIATVVRGSGSFTPTGNVTWTSNGSGNFVTSPCVLSGSNGTASCSVSYTPNAVGTGSHLLTATYSGDDYFGGSSGDQAVSVVYLSLSKAATEASFNAAGVTLHYTLVATNDGNVTLSNVSISDPLLGTLVCTPVLIAFAGEMARFRQPGGVTANLAAAVLAITYLGLLPSFALRLRLEWGIGAFGAMVIVVKMGDTGAYFFGKLFGRHKMAPVLSPNKTIEGAVGAICFSLLGAWAAAFSVVPLAPPTAAHQNSALVPPFLGWTLFALLVSLAGMFGDLAESLLKRDSGSRNSSGWMPGLGGVLDLLDSILLAAPVAYLLWVTRIVGP